MTLDEIVTATELALRLPGLTLDDAVTAVEQSSAELATIRAEFLSGSSKGTPHVMHIIHYRQRRHQIATSIAGICYKASLPA